MYFKIDLAPEKWRLTFRVVTINVVLVFAVVWIMYLLGEVTVNNFQTFNGQYFWPIEKFWQFVREKSFSGVVLEEVFYRGPVWFLSSAGLIFYLGKYRAHLVFIWPAILIPDYFWAMSHVPAKLPVFITGISLGWLVYKTKALWPAIAAHALSNLSIYFAIKIAAVFIRL